jgi:hypothetical protein
MDSLESSPCNSEQGSSKKQKTGTKVTFNTCRACERRLEDDEETYNGGACFQCAGTCGLGLSAHGVMQVLKKNPSK